MSSDKKRTLLVGDVHGCFRELTELLEKVDFDPSGDRLIFLGDIINRGPHSGKVLELVHSIPCEVVLGNHELGLTKYVQDKSPPNPDFEEVLQQMEDKRDDYLAWMENLPTFIETPAFLAVHAGLIPNLSPQKHPPEIITRLRTWGGDFHDLDNPAHPPWYELYTGKKLVVYGHWALKGLTVRENTIGLDSGCVWGGALSALELPGRKITQVKAHAVYADPSVKKK